MLIIFISQNDMKKVNIIIGRFQPFTYGHLKCVEEAWKVKKLKSVVVMIDTPEAKVDEKHPFPSTMLLPIYKDVFAKSGKIVDVVLCKSANIVEIGEVLKDNGYEISSWTCGTDRIDAYQKMSDKYHDDAHLAEDFEMIEIKRTADDISATKARKALIDDDLNTWKRMTPLYNLREKLEGNRIYKELQNQILKVVK